MTREEQVRHLRALLSERNQRLRELKFWAHRLGLPNSLTGNQVRNLLNLRRPLVKR